MGKYVELIDVVKVYMWLCGKKYISESKYVYVW